MSIEVLHRRFVTPGDVIHRQAECGGDALAFGRTGGPAPEDNGGDTAFVEAGLLDEIGERDVFQLTEIPDADGHVRSSPSSQTGDSGYFADPSNVPN